MVTTRSQLVAVTILAGRRPEWGTRCQPNVESQRMEGHTNEAAAVNLAARRRRGEDQKLIRDPVSTTIPAVTSPNLDALEHLGSALTRTSNHRSRSEEGASLTRRSPNQRSRSDCRQQGARQRTEPSRPTVQNSRCRRLVDSQEVHSPCQRRLIGSHHPAICKVNHSTSVRHSTNHVILTLASVWDKHVHRTS